MTLLKFGLCLAYSFFGLLIIPNAFGISERCSFNAGNCSVHPRGGQGFVQDYGYGSFGGTLYTAARAASNPLASLIEVVSEGPPNPECSPNGLAHIQTGLGSTWNGRGGASTTTELIEISCGREGYFQPNLREMVEFANQLESSEYIDAQVEELAFLSAVGDVHDFTLCQKGLFDSYYSNEQVRDSMLDNAYEQFLDVAQAMAPVIGRERVGRGRGPRPGTEARRLRDLGQTLEGDARIQHMVQHCRNSDCAEITNAVLSRIPLGNRDSMREAIKDYILANPDALEDTPEARARFRNMYAGEVRTLRNSVYDSLEDIDSITINSTTDDRKWYCINNELKDNIQRSGQLDNTLLRLGDEATLRNFSRRAQNRYGREGEIIGELLMVPTYFAGYGVARLALRAGASTVRTIAAGGEALSVATRAAMIGIEAADWGSAFAGMQRDCHSQAFFARVEGGKCNAQDEVGQVYEESSFAQCISSAVLPFASAFVGAGVRVASSGRLDAIYNLPNPRHQIVVTGSRDPFLTGNQSTNAFDYFEQTLRLNADNLAEQLTPEIARGLNQNRRAFAINQIAGRELDRPTIELLLDNVKYGDQAGGPARRTAVLDALIANGMTRDEALVATRRLFNSHVLGDAPASARRVAAQAEQPADSGRRLSRRQQGSGGRRGRQTNSVTEGNPTPVRGGETDDVAAAVVRESDGARFVDEIEDTLDEVIPDSWPRTTADGATPLTYRTETLAEIEAKIDGWMPASVRTEALDLIRSANSNEQLRRRYLAILLNTSPANDPSAAISRLKRLRDNPGNPEVYESVMREIDDQVTSLAERMRGRDIYDAEAVALGEIRSALLLERTLIDLGDEVNIRGLFSARSHNAAVDGHGHSLDGGINLDIEVVGSNVRFCRGSMGTVSGAFSGAAGGFLTMCRRGGYIDRNTAGDVLAAPGDNTVQGALSRYGRFNRFDVTPPLRISMGRNGPVQYKRGVSAGTGGNGGGIEYFTNRWGESVPLSDLAASVRIPTCNRGAGTVCNEIFNIQERIRLDALDSAGGKAQGRLATAETQVNNMINDILRSSNFDVAPRAGESVDDVLNRLSRDHPDLGSALNLRREIEVKRAQYSTPGERARLDKDTQIMYDLTLSAQKSGAPVRTIIQGNPSDVGAIRRNLSETLQKNGLLVAYARNQRKIESLFAQSRTALNPKDRVRTLERLNDLRGRQEDLRTVANTLSYEMKSAVQQAGGVARRDNWETPVLNEAQVNELTGIIDQAFVGIIR